jgi:hypothetical protein
MQPESLSAPAGGGIRFRRRTQIQPVYVAPTGLKGQKDILFPHGCRRGLAYGARFAGSLRCLIQRLRGNRVRGLPHLL